MRWARIKGCMVTVLNRAIPFYVTQFARMTINPAVLISLLIYKLGVRLPIRQFFQINAILLFLLAVVFTGQGIAALQEAGIVSTSLLNFPRIEVLGVYPTAQSLGLQLLVLVLGAGLLMYQKKMN